MNPQEQKKLEKKVREILSEKIQPQDKILLGISGGPDSIFLFHQLKNYSKNLYLAHLNHNLRATAKKEETFIQKLHDSEKTFIKNANFTNFTEEKGRKARYEFFEKLANEHKIKWILTAHHADDNLETILLNLTRGANISGLTGIPQLHKNIFRPLLTITKKEIISYLKAKKLPFIIDKSNENNAYSRNKIRNLVIPILKEINPSLEKTVAENIKPLKELEKFIEEKAQNWLKRNPNLEVAKFNSLKLALKRRIILEIHRKNCGHTQNIENIHIEEILELIEKKSGNKKKKLGQITFAIKNHKVYVQKKTTDI